MPDENILNVALPNLELFEDLYKKYLKDEENVDPHWQKVFAAFEREVPMQSETSKFTENDSKKLKVYRLIEAYRTFGHLAAKVNPINNKEAIEPWQLSLEHLGFSKEDFPQNFPTCGFLKEGEAPLRELISALKETYCGQIAFEYMGFQSPELESWLQKKIEPTRSKAQLSIDQKQEILQHLNKSELLEAFLHTKYMGQKRFSIEGGETLIPMLAALVEVSAQDGIKEFYLGMAHRGRLNVLANIIHKSFSEIFSEFDEGYIPDSFEGSGDVKYHKGFFSDVQTIHGHKIQINLIPNPSHLESVNPVVEGEVFARQIKLNDTQKKKVLAVLVHGDAALAGQGIIYETLQLYRLPNYSTGGTVHIVVNNQIGFTTLPNEARSTHYCTDIAKAFGAPIFHVNAEDPETCVYATLLAIELRQKFHCDVFIDLNCYRKYGHNEGDEPAFTQPLEYKVIRAKKPIREIYRDHLISQGLIEKYMAESLENEFKKSLRQALKATKPDPIRVPESIANVEEAEPPSRIETKVSYKLLREVAEQICATPPNFTLHPKLEHLLKDRLNMVIPKGKTKPLDWGMAELLAYGTLSCEGIPIRLSGQDTGRGTFSHRHALWIDQRKTQSYFPLSHVHPQQARADIVNSPLSEFASLGFEYGYSVAYPESLVIWEAQFGDFANGAQVIIDQYISSAEQKWGQKSGIVLYLPHGYEGQGPEHSSARIERFLSLAGNRNLIIAYPTTPAQMFHLVRRQIIGKLLKPLIIMTPKGLLRLPECSSSIEDLENDCFEEILDDGNEYKKAKRVIFCCGRIFYDLKAERDKRKDRNIAIIRIEQLYPLNRNKLKTLLDQYALAKELFWVQEEPENMGAWSYIHSQIMAEDKKNRGISYVGRLRSAAPATGSYASHKKEIQTIINKIFDEKKPSALDIAQHFRV
ncbi:2-oxoglutarate dehydrogenase E1 component [Chlamydiales bacterium STE3]|nr:2-oxoglutarate dehydrogenase E1 component [Chlamydiales bacterium STE3]